VSGGGQRLNLLASSEWLPALQLAPKVRAKASACIAKTTLCDNLRPSPTVKGPTKFQSTGP